MSDCHSVPTDFSDYDHYILYEGRDDADDKGIPVYQSKSTGMLFAEALARAMIKVSGWTKELERIANSNHTQGRSHSGLFMTALHPKADIRLISSERSANDPERT